MAESAAQEASMADGFLGRWSRRKQEVREGKPVAEPEVQQPPVAGAVPAAAAGSTGVAAAPASVAQPPAAEPPVPAPTLADADALTPTSDFTPFVDRAVSPEVRNLAMKKLFADPHFNVMDGLDIYVGDYTQPDPLPAGMLRKMASAHTLGFFDHEKKQAPEDGVNGEGAESPASPAEQGTANSPEEQCGNPPAHDPMADAPALGKEAGAGEDVAQSGVCNAIPSDPCSASSSEPDRMTAAPPGPVDRSASHTEHDDHAHLRLQPDDAPQRQGLGRGTA
jgi:hypothetical protein